MNESPSHTLAISDLCWRFMDNREEAAFDLILQNEEQ